MLDRAWEAAVERPAPCQTVQINTALRGTQWFSWNPNEAVFCVCVLAGEESVALK